MELILRSFANYADMQEEARQSGRDPSVEDTEENRGDCSRRFCQIS